MSKNNNIEEKLNQLGRTIAPDPSITDAVMHRIQREIPAPAPGRFTMLKKQIKWLTAAAAIVIVVFVFTFTSNTGKQGLAWAQIAQQVQQARSFSYKLDMTMNGITAEGQPPVKDQKMTWTYLFSVDYGMKTQSFAEDQLASEIYINPGNNSAVMLMHHAKQFMRMEFDEETAQKRKQQHQDPREILKQLLNCSYTSIGRDTIDGVEVEGIESSDPKMFGGVFETCHTRIWSDIRDGWPVQIEFSCTANNGQMETSSVIHDFQWNIDVDPAEFEYTIPNDYSEIPKMQMPAMNADTAVTGLKKFVEFTGRYPKSLNLMALMKEFSEGMKQGMENMNRGMENWTDEAKKEFMNKHDLPPKGSLNKDQITQLAKDMAKNKAAEITKEVAGKVNEMMMTEAMPVQFLGMFYMQLVQQDKDPAYYGELVNPEDADLPLLRWKSADEEYTVIFGDLHTETLSPDQLTQLESKLPR